MDIEPGTPEWVNDSMRTSCSEWRSRPRYDDRALRLLLVRFALTAEGLYRVQVVTLMSGSLFPLAANLAFLAGAFDTPLDVTPPTFALSSLLTFAGVARGRFTHPGRPTSVRTASSHDPSR